MTRDTAIKTIRELGAKIRNNLCSKSENESFDETERVLSMFAPSTKINAWYDLPIAAGMWLADGLSVEK
jgi:hypothetical protein